MKNMIIDKEFLNGYKTFTIVFENLDVYTIDIEDILDIYCEVNPSSERNEAYATNDGFIKISSRVAHVEEQSSLKYNEEDPEWPTHLKERLEMFDSGVDLVYFSLNSDRKREVVVCVPYDPIESVINGKDIELSNSSSFEIDSEGNMIIAFGERSKQPKRKDNNYHELVLGWQEAFGEYKPIVLKVRMLSCNTFGVNNNNVSCSFEIRGSQNKGRQVELEFIDCKDLAFFVCFPQIDECEIVMTRMVDGRIYVGFAGLGVEFTCLEICEEDYYNNK